VGQKLTFSTAHYKVHSEISKEPYSRWVSNVPVLEVIKMKSLKTVLCLAVLVLAVSCSSKKGGTGTLQSGLTPEEIETASYKVIQDKILIPKCATCHQVKNGKIPPHEVDLTSYEKLNGGHHVLVVPGKPEKSELFISITRTEDRMPYNEPALSDDEILIIRNWILKGGKKTPTGSDGPGGHDHDDHVH